MGTNRGGGEGGIAFPELRLSLWLDATKNETNDVLISFDYILQMKII